MSPQYPRNLLGECKCTGPGKDCACVREFLLHTRPPGINGYDGLDLNIQIVADDKCNVLYDLMAGAIPHPSESGALHSRPGVLCFVLLLAAAMGAADVFY